MCAEQSGSPEFEVWTGLLKFPAFFISLLEDNTLNSDIQVDENNSNIPIIENCTICIYNQFFLIFIIYVNV